MKNFKNFLILALLVSASAFAQQNTLVQTSLSAAVTANQTFVVVASATGINAPSSGVPGSALYIVDFGQTKGELAQVISVTSTTIGLRRSGAAKAHASGSMVLVATSPNWFASSDPMGSCTTATTFATPYLNTVTGNQWLCSTITLTWVPGFGNYNAPVAATAAVASAAGLVTPSGPLMHFTGALAITGFNIPVGYNGGPICIVPDGAFTTTTANNIALASTGVVSKALCYQYEKAAAKPFFPAY